MATNFHNKNCALPRFHNEVQSNSEMQLNGLFKREQDPENETRDTFFIWILVNKLTISDLLSTLEKGSDV